MRKYGLDIYINTKELGILTYTVKFEAEDKFKAREFAKGICEHGSTEIEDYIKSQSNGESYNYTVGFERIYDKETYYLN